MTPLALRTPVALALIAGLLVAPRLAGAQVVIQNDDDTQPAPTSTAPPPPPPTAPPPAAPAPANPNLGLTSPPAPGAPADTSDKTKVDVGSGGVAVTQEEVKRVKEPPSSVVNVALDIGGGTILGLADTTIGFANADLKVKILAGGKFPGPDGGMWNGIIFEPQVSLLAVALQTPTIIAGAQFPGKTSATFGFQAGGAVGWQFLTFGTMSEGGLKQHGFGLELGGYLGATGVNPPSGSMQVNASYGPVVGLSFPTYNAGTARYSSFSITFFVLPTGDGSVLVSGGLGWIF
jgi:hypothetical protein